jgi:hypothetical protein
MIPLNVLDSLQDSLSNAVILENWKLRLSRQTDMRAKFNAPDLTVRQDSQWMTINVNGQEITLPKAATDEQIAAEIGKLRIERPMPTIAEQLADARAKLAAARKSASDAVADSADAASVVLRQIEKVQKETADLRAEVASLTNGGPDLDEPKEPSTP